MDHLMQAKMLTNAKLNLGRLSAWPGPAALLLCHRARIASMAIFSITG